jgi:hypothetical protein
MSEYDKAIGEVHDAIYKLGGYANAAQSETGRKLLRRLAELTSLRLYGKVV